MSGKFEGLGFETCDLLIELQTYLGFGNSNPRRDLSHPLLRQS